MDLQNFTGKLERGEAFVRAKAAHADTGGLSVHIKFTRAKGRDVNGYYRWDDRRMVLAVKQRLRYPRHAAYGVGTQSRDWQRLGGRPYRLLWHEETFASPDDLLVFVAGHEFWHFLCHSGQRKRDHETRANCNGFAWLREFRAWEPGIDVEGIPLLPPRPDRALDEAVAAMATPTSTVAMPTPPLVPSSLAAPPPVDASPARRSRTAVVLDAARQLLLFR